jgi:PIN domain nuclease of toxin-antitoxin system
LASVLDSSALLAYLFEEPGADIVARELVSGIISAVNMGEVTTKLIDRGFSPAQVSATIDDMPLTVHAFELRDAVGVAFEREATREQGLSLGDRACLALARRLGLPALTADRVWAALDLGIEVRLIRD